MNRCTFVALICMGVASCSSPFSSGPGRVEITLDQTAVRSVSQSVLFSSSGAASSRERDVVELQISSATDLIKYFKDWDRQLQVRCGVRGNTNGRQYRGWARGPIPHAKDARDSRFRYTIFSFIDLQADDVEFDGGKPAGTLDLRSGEFGSLNCYLLGVTKAPVLFPRSNDVDVSVDTFRALLKSRVSR
jgi:hypothetical protein